MTDAVMDIVDMPTSAAHLERAAEVLWLAFREDWPNAWPTIDDARAEVHAMQTDGRICRAAMRNGRIVGWIGGLPEYNGNVWELHPLAVHPHMHGQGIGRALVIDFEARVAERGGLTIMLGTDDESGMTSLSGVNLYDDLPARIAGIRNLRRHPYEFYRRLGYTIVGVMPDANGSGKPDIYMAKRVRGDNRHGDGRHEDDDAR